MKLATRLRERNPDFDNMPPMQVIEVDDRPAPADGLPYNLCMRINGCDYGSLDKAGGNVDRG